MDVFTTLQRMGGSGDNNVDTGQGTASAYIFPNALKGQRWKSITFCRQGW